MSGSSPDVNTAQQIDDIENHKRLEDTFENQDNSEYQPIHQENEQNFQETRPGVLLLRSWLNKSFKVEMTDGRVLIGIFLCTDRDANIILGSCSEYLPSDCKGKITNEEPRMLGLVMIPGKHIVNLQLDSNEYELETQKPLSMDVNPEEIM